MKIQFRTFFASVPPRPAAYAVRGTVLHYKVVLYRRTHSTATCQRRPVLHTVYIDIASNMMSGECTAHNSHKSLENERLMNEQQ